MPTIDGHDYEAEDTLLVSDPAKLRAMARPMPRLPPVTRTARGFCGDEVVSLTVSP